MKQITIILILFLFASCYTDVQKVDNPKEITTIKIQELEKHNANISIEGKYLYVFNKDNEVVYMFKQKNPDSSPVHGMYLFFIHLFLFISVFILISVIRENNP